jgi:hypothetical protein
MYGRIRPYLLDLAWFGVVDVNDVDRITSDTLTESQIRFATNLILYYVGQET